MICKPNTVTCAQRIVLNSITTLDKDMCHMVASVSKIAMPHQNMKSVAPVGAAFIQVGMATNSEEAPHLTEGMKGTGTHQ